MTIHSFIEYLKYRWKARNRHGVHSPFVYALVEDVIENRKQIIPVTTPIPWAGEPGTRYDILVRRIAAYYRYRNIASLPVTTPCDMLLLNDEPQNWQTLISSNLHLITNDGVMILQGIYSTAAHTAAWKNVCADAPVRLSIDLYGIGLLFFRKEFKEKQHFVLRVGG